MTVLAGDIGGTKCNFGLFTVDNGVLSGRYKKTFKSADYGTLQEALREFFDTIDDTSMQGKPEAAVLGVAGPVINRACVTLNLPWEISEDDIELITGASSVRLINDLEANAWGVLELNSHQLLTLNEGVSNSIDNQAIISAGTGLGEAFMLRVGDNIIPCASEGGHADFAPANRRQLAFCDWLMRKYGHASYERVLSGPGLVNTFEYILESTNTVLPGWLQEEMAHADKAAVISKTAMSGKFKACEDAMDMFTSIYGSEAGNLVLKYKALGGIYLGGGIAPKIVPWLEKEIFLESFFDKGRFREMLEQTRVEIILEQETALLGAARLASSLAI
jgi:glucokinase